MRERLNSMTEQLLTATATSVDSFLKQVAVRSPEDHTTIADSRRSTTAPAEAPDWHSGLVFYLAIAILRVSS